MEPAPGGRGLELLLLHEINAGTFARLYLAETRGAGGVDRIVAVKILREQWEGQQDIVNRTRDEARLLARLRHKNILKVEDLVEIDGQTAIIMEYVDGLDLKELVDALVGRRQRVPAKVALQIVLESASALEAAYFRVPTGLDGPLRVVHRDLKPSNIMLSVEGEVRVLDFGTARSTHAFRSAETGAMRFGSLKYMSPERRDGDRGEHAGDIYALGLVLLELLRSEWLPLLPMDAAEHDSAIAQAIARLDQLGMPNSEWDLTLRRVLGQMLASEPSVRPNAEQVVKLLRAFVEQTSGPTLDRFAYEVVQAVSCQVHGERGGGALAGRTVTVNQLEGGRPRGPRVAPTQAPAPGSPAQGVAPSRTAEPRPAARSPAAWATASESVPPPAGGNRALAVGAGIVVTALIGLLLLALVGGGLWAFLRRGEAPIAPSTLVLPGTALPPEAPGGPAAVLAGAPVSVTVLGQDAQWVKLERDGVVALESRRAMDGAVPEGEYTLVVKLVGREPLHGPLVLAAQGVSLQCEGNAAGNLSCIGGKRALTLKP